MEKIKLPRLEQNGKLIVFPSQFNNAMTELETEINKISDKIDDFNKKTSNLTDRLDGFYGKLIEIFGIFVAIFSLIIISVQNLIFTRGKDVWGTAWNSLGYLMPLTLVLLIFILLLRWIRK